MADYEACRAGKYGVSVHAFLALSVYRSGKLKAGNLSQEDVPQDFKLFGRVERPVQDNDPALPAQIQVFLKDCTGDL